MVFTCQLLELHLRCVSTLTQDIYINIDSNIDFPGRRRNALETLRLSRRVYVPTAKTWIFSLIVNDEGVLLFKVTCFPCDAVPGEQLCERRLRMSLTR